MSNRHATPDFTRFQIPRKQPEIATFSAPSSPTGLTIARACSSPLSRDADNRPLRARKRASEARGQPSARGQVSGGRCAERRFDKARLMQALATGVEIRLGIQARPRRDPWASPERRDPRVTDHVFGLTPRAPREHTSSYVRVGSDGMGSFDVRGLDVYG